MSASIHVINLDRSPERLRAFRDANSHLSSVERFAAVDGAAQSIDDLKANRIVAQGITYSVGAVGAALSHLQLWQMAVERNTPLTICEDDALLHREFQPTADRLLSNLRAGWDIVQWTWSFQSSLHYELLQGGASCVTQCDFSEMRERVAAWQEAAHPFNLYRLRKSFGAICYTVSPAGARKLREAALPLRPMTVWFPLHENPIPNVGIDVVMRGLYEKLSAYVCVPPLALAPQKHDSTIFGTRPASARSGL